MKSKPCIQPDCDRPVDSWGWCQTHANRHRRGLDMGAPIRQWDSGRICDLDGCNRPHVARGFCKTHHERIRVNGHPGDAAIGKYSRTGRKVDGDGYVWIKNPRHALAMSNGYVAEHRLVVFEAGTEIPDGHHVHHINGDRTDNRLENLEVLSIAEHTRRHAEQHKAAASLELTGTGGKG